MSHWVKLWVSQRFSLKLRIRVRFRVWIRVGVFIFSLSYFDTRASIWHLQVVVKICYGPENLGKKTFDQNFGPKWLGFCSRLTSVYAKSPTLARVGGGGGFTWLMHCKIKSQKIYSNEKLYFLNKKKNLW